MLTPSSARTSAEPLRLVMLRLPCLATGTPAAAATMAAVVLMLKRVEPPPPVPQVSSNSVWWLRMGVMCRRRAVAAPAISSTVSPLAASAVRKRPISFSDHWPSMIDVHGGGHLVHGEVFAAGDAAEDRGVVVGHVQRLGRKLRIGTIGSCATHMDTSRESWF